MGGIVVILGADKSSSVHIDNRPKGILILSEGPTQGLDGATLTVEANCPINFKQPNKWFVLGLHYNESNSFLFVNSRKIYQFKAKGSKIKDYTLCWGIISNNFSLNNLKKAGLKGM